jgi:hypothetical protein
MSNIIPTGLLHAYADGNKVQYRHIGTVERNGSANTPWMDYNHNCGVGLPDDRCQWRVAPQPVIVHSCVGVGPDGKLFLQLSAFRNNVTFRFEDGKLVATNVIS